MHMRFVVCTLMPSCTVHQFGHNGGFHYARDPLAEWDMGRSSPRNFHVTLDSYAYPTFVLAYVKLLVYFIDTHRKPARNTMRLARWCFHCEYHLLSIIQDT